MLGYVSMTVRIRMYVCMALPPWRHPLTQADILPLIYARKFHREILRLRTLKCFDSLLFIVNNKDKIFNK